MDQREWGGEGWAGETGMWDGKGWREGAEKREREREREREKDRERERRGGGGEKCTKTVGML